MRGRNSFLTFLHRRHLVRCRFSFAVKHWGEQHESVATVPLHAWVSEFADAHDIAGGDHSHLRLCDRPERSIRGTEYHWTGWYRSEWQLQLRSQPRPEVGRWTSQPKRYTFVIDFRIDDLNGWRKIVDFKNLTSDEGFYVKAAGQLRWYGGGSEGPLNAIQPNTTVRVALTRDSSSGQVAAYVNGVQHFTEIDINSVGILSQRTPSIFCATMVWKRPLVRLTTWQSTIVHFQHPKSKH